MTHGEKMAEEKIWDEVEIYEVRIECDAIMRPTIIRQMINLKFIGAGMSQVLNDAIWYLHHWNKKYPNWKIIGIKILDEKIIEVT